MRVYELTSPLLAAVFATWLYHDSASEKSNKNAFYTYLVLYSLILFFGLYSSIVAFVDLSESGISRAIRTLALKRHVSLIALYCFSNFYIALQSYYGLKGELLYDRSEVNGFLKMWKILFYSQFLIGPSFRFSESAFKIALKKTLYRDLRYILCQRVGR